MEKNLKELLEAEEEANQLVEQLKALKKEIGSYKDAKDAISKTSSSLTTVSSKFGDAADGVYELIKVMREHGTTEIINKQQEIITKGDALDEELKRIQEHVDTLASDSNVSEMRSEIATLLNEKHDELALEITNKGEILDKKLKLIQKHADTLALDSNVSDVKLEITTLLNEKHDALALEISKIITSLETLTYKNRIYSLWSIALTSLAIFILSYLAYTSFTS